MSSTRDTKRHRAEPEPEPEIDHYQLVFDDDDSTIFFITFIVTDMIHDLLLREVVTYKKVKLIIDIVLDYFKNLVSDQVDKDKISSYAKRIASAIFNRVEVADTDEVREIEKNFLHGYVKFSADLSQEKAHAKLKCRRLMIDGANFSSIPTEKHYMTDHSVYVVSCAQFQDDRDLVSNLREKDFHYVNQEMFSWYVRGGYVGNLCLIHGLYSRNPYNGTCDFSFNYRLRSETRYRRGTLKYLDDKPKGLSINREDVANKFVDYLNKEDKIRELRSIDKPTSRDVRDIEDIVRRQAYIYPELQACMFGKFLRDFGLIFSMLVEARNYHADNPTNKLVVISGDRMLIRMVAYLAYCSRIPLKTYQLIAYPSGDRMQISYRPIKIEDGKPRIALRFEKCDIRIFRRDGNLIKQQPRRS